MSAPHTDSSSAQPQPDESHGGDPSPAQSQDGSSENKPVRLTDEEKKRNHVASEHKRRQGIREGFDRLATIVPGLQGFARSEGLVISGSVAYMEDQLILNKKLREDIEAAGGKVVEEPRPESAKAEERKLRSEHGDSDDPGLLHVRSGE